MDSHVVVMWSLRPFPLGFSFLSYPSSDWRNASMGGKIQVCEQI